LKVSDVYQNGKVKERVQLTEHKTGKFKDFILNASAKRVIKEYLNTRDHKPDEALFISRASGLSIKRNEAYKIINNATIKAGITDRIGTHTLRKTFGYHSYKNGVDLSLIQKILQHSSPAITLSYIGITRDDIDSAYLKLNL
jgi:site-specific recombinase XerD